MKIDKELIERIESGNVGKKIMKLILDNRDLFGYAWDKRMAVKKNPRLFFVAQLGEEPDDFVELREKYNARSLESCMLSGKPVKAIYLMEPRAELSED